jgi:CHAT domain-containing protein/Tfp pilus assembly protein PilF
MMCTGKITQPATSNQQPSTSNQHLDLKILNTVMTTITKPTQPGRLIILSGLFLFLLSYNVLDAQQLSRDELNSELRKALEQNDESRSVALIKDNRLLVKPFVDGLIKESITAELKGKTGEAAKLKVMSANAAKYFESAFGEKSLSIAVNYLTIWTKDQKEKKLAADSLYAIGIQIRGNKQERDKAIEYHQKALDLYEEIGDERGESEVLGGLGLIYTSINYDTSLEYYKEALIKREKVDDRILMGNTLNSIGSLYYGIFEDYSQALNYFDRAEVVRTELGDSLNLGRTIHLKASTLENLGQNELSLEYYKKSLRLNQSSGDQGRVAEALKNSGTILNNMGKYPEALEYLGKAEKAYRVLEDSTGLSDSFNQIGYVYLNLGDLNTALEKFNVAVSITKKLNDQWGLAGIYNNLGIMLQNAGRYEKALEYSTNALKIYEELKDQSSIIVSLNNIGTIYFDMKDYQKAEENYQRGLKICRELKVKDQEANYLLNLANAQSLTGRMDEALQNYQEGFKIARTLNSPDLAWKYITGLAEYYETTGEYDKVVELNDTALKILEGLRSTLPADEFRSTFMAKERYVFEDIIDLLETLYEKDRTKGYDKLAFLYAEQSKSRVLLDMLSKAELTFINEPGNGNLRNPEPVSIDEAKTLCTDKNTVILEYSVGDSSSCLWVITQSDYKLFKLPRRKKLQEQIETIRFSLLDPQQGISDFFTNAGSLLYEELIRPAESFLTKKSKLILIPDGVLNYLPFEVLLTENKKPTANISYSDLPFLVKKYPVSYGQSASVLKTLISKPAEEAGKKAVDKRLLAMGDPLYEDTSFNLLIKYPRLGYTGKEIENISSYFAGGSSEIYLRNKATEENLKRNNELNKFNYIHFATHGLINEDKPDMSSLVLTSEKNSGEDGFLQAAEIFNLKLNADLVVLSACQTGLGKLVRGEGMVGLARAFMYAGTPSVLASLWSVSDMSTASLMGEFYKNLIKNKLSKADALRKAQLTLMSDKKYAHPFYWAPFILIGDWR